MPHRIDVHHHIAPPNYSAALKAMKRSHAAWSIEASLEDASGYIAIEYVPGGTLTPYTEPGNLLPVEAAWGIHELANEDMASAARLHLAERGEELFLACCHATWCRAAWW